MEKIKCQHNYEEKKNKLICSKCGKSELLLRETEKEGLQVGIKEDGKTYSVRDNRNRYFYPNEWNEFIKNVSDKLTIIFLILIITGARIREAMMIKKRHIKWDKHYVILYTTKIKAKKQERKSKTRDVSLSKSLLRKLKEHTKNMNDNDYIFLNNEKCKGLTEKEIKESIAENKCKNVYQIFKRALAKTTIEDTYNFSLHNIRKTCGMYLKCLKIPSEEICLRLGHDIDTYLKHYGSADIFDPNTKKDMINILGDIYGLR